MPRIGEYYTECFICLAPAPFIDKRPQLCEPCKRAIDERPPGFLALPFIPPKLRPPDRS